MLKFLALSALLISAQLSAQSQEEMVKMQLEANEEYKKSKSEIIIDDGTRPSSRNKIGRGSNPSNDMIDDRLRDGGISKDKITVGKNSEKKDVDPKDANKILIREGNKYIENKPKEGKSNKRESECIGCAADKKPILISENHDEGRDEVNGIINNAVKLRQQRLSEFEDCTMGDDQLTISCPQGEYVKKPSTVDNIRKVVDKSQPKQKSSGSKSSKATKK